MTGTRRPPAGGVMERTLERRWSVRDELGGILAIAAAVALWVTVLVGVAAPLGDALARMDRRARAEPAPVVRPVQPCALASAAAPAGC